MRRFLAKVQNRRKKAAPSRMKSPKGTGAMGALPRLTMLERLKNQGTVYLLEKTRCPLCGDVHTAPVPEGIGDDKYDESVTAMVGILKYGNGMPFKRLETLQKQLGAPLPASTQFELLDDAAGQLGPVHQELMRQAAQGEVATFDDTRAQIIDEAERPADQDEDRVGIKTTGSPETSSRF